MDKSDYNYYVAVSQTYLDHVRYASGRAEFNGGEMTVNGKPIVLYYDNTTYPENPDNVHA